MPIPTIYLTVGISGSGKSRFAKSFCESSGRIELNADEVRKSLGDISSQEKNDEVWRIIDRQTIAHLAGGDSIFLSNTNLHFHGIKTLRKKFPYNQIVIYVMGDSNDVELCKSRVKADLDSGVERSNVPMEVIDDQYSKFLDILLKFKTKEDRGTLGENTKIYLVKSGKNYSLEEI